MRRIVLREPYVKRRIRFLHVLEHASQRATWKVKLYSVTYQGTDVKSDTPNERVLREGIQEIQRSIEQFSHREDHYELGFGIIHQGRDHDFASLFWIGQEHMIHNRVSSRKRPARQWTQHWRNPLRSEVFACTFDIEVIDFERRAWQANILMAPPEEPNVKAYLAQRLQSTDV
jgi:hypothetical protein